MPGRFLIHTPISATGRSSRAAARSPVELEEISLVHSEADESATMMMQAAMPISGSCRAGGSSDSHCRQVAAARFGYGLYPQ